MKKRIFWIACAVVFAAGTMSVSAKNSKNVVAANSIVTLETTVSEAQDDAPQYAQLTKAVKNAAKKEVKKQAKKAAKETYKKAKNGELNYEKAKDATKKTYEKAKKAASKGAEAVKEKWSEAFD